MDVPIVRFLTLSFIIIGFIYLLTANDNLQHYIFFYETYRYII